MPRIENSGFSLVEVMIAIFLLAVGVVGVAGMQLAALRTTQQSAFQTSAVQLANEIADKMRANPASMELSDDLNPYLAVDYRSAVDADSTSTRSMCFTSAANCRADEMTAFGIEEWKSRVKTFLPGGRAVICRDSQPWNSSAKAYRWPCDAASGGPLVVKLGWLGKNPDGSMTRDGDKQIPPGVVLTVGAH